MCVRACMPACMCACMLACVVSCMLAEVNVIDGTLGQVIKVKLLHTYMRACLLTCLLAYMPVNNSFAKW